MENRVAAQSLYLKWWLYATRREVKSSELNKPNAVLKCDLRQTCWHKANFTNRTVGLTLIHDECNLKANKTKEINRNVDKNQEKISFILQLLSILSILSILSLKRYTLHLTCANTDELLGILPGRYVCSFLSITKAGVLGFFLLT